MSTAAGAPPALEADAAKTHARAPPPAKSAPSEAGSVTSALAAVTSAAPAETSEPASNAPSRVPATTRWPRDAR